MAIYYIPSSEGWASQKASNTSVPSGAARLRVKVDRAYNQSTNISTLVFSLEMYSANYSSSSFVAYDGGTFTSQGTQASIDHHYYVSLNADTTWRPVTYEGSSSPATWTRTVQHDSDGNATITAAVNFTIHYTSSYRMLFNNSGSFSVHEARMSDVSASNGYFGNTIPITVTRKSNAFTHNVRVVCLGQTTTIATGSTASSLSWSPAVATYAPLLTGNMSTTATIYCDTYNGSTLIGTRTASITMSLKAADVAPSLSLTIEDATVSPPDATKSCLEYYGAFVATKSKFKITTVPTLAYGASVAATSISANGATYNSSPATTGAIVSAAMNSIAASIVDSRQQSASASQSVTVLAYTMPLINSISAHRCQQDGTLDDGGAYCRVDYDVDITALNNHNSKTLKVGIKKVTDANYTETTVTLSAYSATGYVVVAANTEFSHDVRISLIDDFSTTVYDTQISSAYVRPLNFRTGGLGIGIGKVSEYDKAVDLASDWVLLKNGQPVPLSEFYNDVFPEQHPIGSIYISVDSTSPASLFGGTWERITGKFLLAATDGGATGSGIMKTASVAAGGTGGEAEHTQTQNEAARLKVPYGAGGSGAYGAISGSVVYTASQPSGFVDMNRPAAQETTNTMPPFIAVYVWKRIA